MNSQTKISEGTYNKSISIPMFINVSGFNILIHRGNVNNNFGG